MRPIEQDGAWGAKQKKEYVLDKDGNKIYDPKKRQYKLSLIHIEMCIRDSTYSKDTITVTNAEQVIFGGTGYDTKNRLPPEVEHSYPDYSIYPQFFVIAYGLSCLLYTSEENCMTSNVASLRSVKVATPPCAAKAAIPCGLAGRKRF